MNNFHNKPFFKTLTLDDVYNSNDCNEMKCESMKSFQVENNRTSQIGISFSYWIELEKSLNSYLPIDVFESVLCWLASSS